MPHDLVIGDVYLPPMLIAGILALIGASYTTRLLKRRGWMARFANPPLLFIALAVIYTVLLGSTLIST